MKVMQKRSGSKGFVYQDRNSRKNLASQVAWTDPT